MAHSAGENLRRRISLWWIAPICLLLVSMGMRVPNVAPTHTPKPRPRAIVESSSKTCQDATTKKIIEAMELYASVDVLQRNEFVAGPCPGPSFTYSSAIPAPTGARAPPFPLC
jgi:hypothetical protein